MDSHENLFQLKIMTKVSETFEGSFKAQFGT